MLQCIVTCGPTYEPLDQVRRLTNFSTGKLGVQLSNYLVKHGAKVTLLKSEAATFPGRSQAHQLLPFNTTENLGAILKSLSSAKPFVIFHAAAVSDFAFGRVFTRSTNGKLLPVQAGKFTTRYDALLAELIPTPKILPRLRRWFPAAKIIGWKYETDGNRDDVIAKGRAQLREARSDAVVLNGPAYGTGYGLLSADNLLHCPIAPRLYRHLLEFARG